MAGAGPLAIPGYRFEAATGKYFRLTPLELAAARQAALVAQADRKQKLRKTTPAPPPPSKGKGRETRSIPAILSERCEGNTGGSTRAALHHRVDEFSWGILQEKETIHSVFSSTAEEIVRISFDERDPSTIRVGGSLGTISSGSLARSRDFKNEHPNDEYGFRPTFHLQGSITSLSTAGPRLLATSLGPPSQAILSPTMYPSAGTAPITFAPLKTSVWSSALSEECFALGCDQKILFSGSQTRAAMTSWSTGGRGGGGTVFALDMTENLIFAGVRKGTSLMYDRRTSGSASSSSSSSTRPEVEFNVSTPIVQLRRLEMGLLVAGMNGLLNLYDVRVPGRVVLEMKGHINSCTRELGFDVLGDEFVAAAGQDGFARLWSLRTGDPVRHSVDSPLHRKFHAPVKALKFASTRGSSRCAAPFENGISTTRSADGWRRAPSGELDGTVEIEGVGGRSRWSERTESELWIASGGALSRFGIRGA